MTDRVVFKMFPEGDVLALFPDLPYGEGFRLCWSYQHVGQHGAASLDLLTELRDATEEEAAPLRNELRSIGYEV